MGVYLNPGSEIFEDALASQIYIDKTELIKYTNRVLKTEQKYICVSRPRRFGKSMAANMLAAYYGRNADSRKYFENLKIANDASFLKHLNQYNVIFLNMQDFLSENPDVEDMEKAIEDSVEDDDSQVTIKEVAEEEEEVEPLLVDVDEDLQENKEEFMKEMENNYSNSVINGDI